MLHIGVISFKISSAFAIPQCNLKNIDKFFAAADALRHHQS
jgi:hypothetical protein